MGLLDIRNTEREKEMAAAIEMLAAVIARQNVFIADLVEKVAENREILQGIVEEHTEHRVALEHLDKEIPEHRESIGELGNITAFIIQQQNEIAAHLMLTENIRKGKVLPGMLDMGVDDDFMN